MNFIELENINSTNDFASKLIKQNKVDDESLIFTHYQYSGRGLSKNVWKSEKSKNILISLILFPNIRVEEFFKLNIIVSLAVVKFLKTLNIEAQIKWPNDIYVKNKKIAGILIENNIIKDKIKSSIIGIGLNLNQEKFDVEIPNPISVKIINKTDYNPVEKSKILGQIIIDYFKQYLQKEYEILKLDYLKSLYKYKLKSNFEDKNGTFKGKIIDIDNAGQLIIETEKSEIRKYFFKEIKFV